MDSIPLGALFGILAGLICLSAFFSSSETALMSINRYRLRHMARVGHKGAILVNRLLEQPDRLIGLILLGNNLVNIAATSLATLIALKLLPQEWALAVSTFGLTFVILIFAEVTPKTFAANHPEIIAYPAAFIYTPLLKFSYYLVIFPINLISNGLLSLFGVKLKHDSHTNLSREELHTVVKETGVMIPHKHRSMLINILELEEATVEDVMVPRNEVIGIDLDEDWDEIIDQLNHVNHTRMPVYKENIDHIVGMLHVKRIMRLMADESFNKDTLEKALLPAYFVPEGTTLVKQLLNFQKEKRRMALVVDEYGDLIGLVALEDILEEIVGEFTTGTVTKIKDIYPQKDGSFVIDGGVHIRDVNKALDWDLPTDGPKTLNGMILEHMEMIPEPGTSLLLHEHPIEIIKTHKNTVKTVQVFPDRQPSYQKDDTQTGVELVAKPAASQQSL